MNKRVISSILLFFWLLVIFYFSSQNGTSSSGLSNSIVEFISNLLHINVSTFIIRKMAHLIEYLILGILMTNFLFSFNINKRLILFSILLCFLYSITDEVHQLFSIGRSGRVLDVCIDTLGSSMGVYLFKKIKKI